MIDSNELFNKYFDGEISKEEMKELNELLSNSPEKEIEFRKIKEALNLFSDYKYKNTSDDFTNKLMKKIIIPNKKTGDKFYFTLIAIMVLLIIVTILFFYKTTNNVNINEIGTFDNMVSGYNSIAKFIHNKNILTVLSFLPISILLFIYFMQSNYKKFKKNIESYSLH